MNTINMNRGLKIIGMTLILILLYFLSRVNYLLFHSFAEIFSVCIAFTIFMIMINSLDYLKNNYLIIIGLAYLFIGFFDLLHTISYKGMNIFTDYDYYANQLWIAARYFESIIIVISLMFMHKEERINYRILFVIFTVVTILIILSIFFSNVFPVCFVEGQGQTSFKLISEYVIIGILFIALFLLWKSRAYFEKQVFRYFGLSIIFTILAEASFTLYIDNYGLTNLVGHYFKIISFYLIYRAIIVKCIKEPYSYIFKELSETKELLMGQNAKLSEEVNLDALTRVFNHGYLYQRVSEEIKRNKRFKTPFTLIFLDIDNFKAVNDQYGHVLGDEVIKETGSLLQKNSRESDIIGRYGGDEFVVMLINTSYDEGRIVSEKIRSAIMEHTYIEKIKITVSIGVAEYTEGSVSQLFDKTDKKLYKAKGQGKNIVV